MAVLSDAQRKEIWAQMMRDLSDVREPIGVTKTDLRAAVDAADQWAQDNAASFNSALPQPARNALTAGQKSRLLAYVIQKRWNTGA